MPTFDFLNLAKKAVNSAIGFALSPIGIFSMSSASIYLILENFTNIFGFVDLPPLDIEAFSIFGDNDLIGFLCYTFAFDKIKTLIFFICDYSFSFIEISLKIVLSSIIAICAMGLSQLIRKTIKSYVD